MNTKAPHWLDYEFRRVRLGVVSGYVSTDDGRMVRVRSLGPHTTIGGNGPDDGPQWRSRRPTAWLGI